jgi:hypothetical protein
MPVYTFLGLIGGFFDAIGGGWGPIVTTTLMARDSPSLHDWIGQFFRVFVTFAEWSLSFWRSGSHF